MCFSFLKRVSASRQLVVPFVGCAWSFRFSVVLTGCRLVAFHGILHPLGTRSMHGVCMKLKGEHLTVARTQRHVCVCMRARECVSVTEKALG